MVRVLGLSAIRLLLIVWPTFLAFGQSWEPQLETDVAWDSNVTNADRSSDVVGALRVRGVFDFTRRVGLGQDDALVVGLQIGGELWPRFNGLDRVALGPRLTWRHKLGLGAFAHVLSIELAGDFVAANESDRAGLAGRAAASWRKRLTPATQVALTTGVTREDADAGVFDRTGYDADFEVVRDLAEKWSLSFTARWRTGDVLSYAIPPRPDLVALARARAPVDTFDEPRMAYSIDARTLGGSIAAFRSISETTSLSLGYDYRHTESGSLRYANHVISAGIFHRFQKS